MLRNYLKGVIGDQLNTILAGTGFNLKKMLNRIKEQILFDLFQIINFWKRLFLRKKTFKITGFLRFDYLYTITLYTRNIKEYKSAQI